VAAQLAEDYTLKLKDILTDGLLSLHIHLGIELGLFTKLGDFECAGATSAELAASLGLNERMTREWLHAMVCGRLVSHRRGGEADEVRYFLAEGQKQVMTGTDCGPANILAAFTYLPRFYCLKDRLANTFRTGVGPCYDTYGRQVACGIKSFFAPWFRQSLPSLIESVDGLKDRLDKGAKVADVGCGAGEALCVMASRYPNSTFDGYDTSQEALKVASETKALWGLKDHVAFKDATVERLPLEPTYDLICTFDCVHDMTFPSEVIKAIRNALKPDGVWLISDLQGASHAADNYTHPQGAMLYSFSVALCLQAAMSEEGGEALGTLGFHQAKAESMARAAGFGHFEVLPFEHPLNSYYLVKINK